MSDEPRYPDVPGSVAGSPTSGAAAEAMIPYAKTVRLKVLAQIKAAGKEGVTCEMLETLMRGRHQGVSARIRELVLEGLVEDSGGTRRNIGSKRDAVVWVAVENPTTIVRGKLPAWQEKALAAGWTPPESKGDASAEIARESAGGAE